MQPRTTPLLAVLPAIAVACSAGASTPLVQSGSPPAVVFRDVTADVGIESPATWKYGGPLVADLDGDGNLDLILGNHDRVMPLLYWGNADGTFTKGHFPAIYPDIHGMAPGDYDEDGDLDLLVAVGGGNGKSPRPPVLLRTEGRQFVDVTQESGLNGVGARGRSVRWVDLDGDGDLDILVVNAIQLPGEEGPRSFVYENKGRGRFAYHPVDVSFEKTDGERVLLTDFDMDGKTDFILFSPLAVWRNHGNFKFEDVSAKVLPPGLVHAPFVTSATEADIDNDRDFDIYVARGKVYYEIANNAVSYSQTSGRLDLRDDGNRGQDGIGFTADGVIRLLDFWHFPRGKALKLPVYLGAAGTRIDTPTDAVEISPEQARGQASDRSKDGWYLSYLGNRRWRLDWTLTDDLAWDVRASVSGVSAVMPDWKPQELGVQDLLLRNDGGRFVDITSELPSEARQNNWGVNAGDFDNDGKIDFFVNTFGELHERRPDLLLHNDGQAGFHSMAVPSATTETGSSHGDMSAAFDFNRDGWLDILTGDDDNGHWHLYGNQTGIRSEAGWSLVVVGRSPMSGIDGEGALVMLTASGMTQIRRVGSSGEVHTQSNVNPVHFGLGKDGKIQTVRVVWRDGTQSVVKNPGARQIVMIGMARQAAAGNGPEHGGANRP